MAAGRGGELLCRGTGELTVAFSSSLQAFPLKQGNPGSTPAGQQPWAASTPSQSFPPSASSQFPNGNNTTASSPLPSNAAQPLSLEQQQSSLRSPPLASSQAPPGVSLLPPSSQAQRPVGAAANNSNSTNLAPHPNQTPGGGAATQSSGAPGQTPQTPAQQVLFSPADRYGLLGLLAIIKTSDPDLNMLALGSDLTTLGLDLGATEYAFCSVSRTRAWLLKRSSSPGTSTRRSSRLGPTRKRHQRSTLNPSSTSRRATTFSPRQRRPRLATLATRRSSSSFTRNPAMRCRRWPRMSCASSLPFARVEREDPC
jgi:hypothetical protein